MSKIMDCYEVKVPVKIWYNFCHSNYYQHVHKIETRTNAREVANHQIFPPLQLKMFQTLPLDITQRENLYQSKASTFSTYFP